MRFIVPTILEMLLLDQSPMRGVAMLVSRQN
jgi:hypothetical protein